LIPDELALDDGRGAGIDGGTGSESSVAADGMAGRPWWVGRKGDMGERDGRAGRDMDGGGSVGRLGRGEVLVALLSVAARLFDAGRLLFRVDSFERFGASSELRRGRSACWN